MAFPISVFPSFQFLRARQQRDFFLHFSGARAAKINTTKDFDFRFPAERVPGIRMTTI
jgi:hypothetical protein